MNVNIPFRLEYENKLIKLIRAKDSFSLELKDGKNSLISNPIECGVAKFIEGDSRTLYATISFTYDFDETNSQLTIISSELNTPESVSFHIGHPGYPHITSSQEHISIDKSNKLKNISSKSPILPDLQSIINQEKEKVNNAIIKEANKNGITVFVKSPLPKMEFDDYLELSSVYNDDGSFVELFDVEKKYDSTKRIVHLASFFKDTVYFAENQKFANVIGSTHDPKVKGKSWLKLWRNAFNAKSKICSSFEFDGFDCTDDSDAGKNLVGGHVILGNKASKVTVGSDDVYIIPICKAHNNNDKVYMQPIYERRAVRLGGFMQDFSFFA